MLRWPALDRSLGTVSLHDLNRARNGEEFRTAIARLQNSPGVAAYADNRDNIGFQVFGLLPSRAGSREAVGSLVLPLDDARWAWRGYVPFEQLPCAFNPDDGAVLYANQYSAEFAAGPYISNRWHPPSRAQRIRRLRDEPEKAGSPLAGWGGDTRQVQPALLFERWIEALCVTMLKAALPLPLATRYLDLWPAHRWNLTVLLFEPNPDWPLEEYPQQLVRAAYRAALRAAQPVPSVSFRHSVRRHPLLRWLFSADDPYEGGSRETVAALRRNCEFLAAGQGGGSGRPIRRAGFGRAEPQFDGSPSPRCRRIRPFGLRNLVCLTSPSMAGREKPARAPARLPN